jgi:hypothetical protein
MARHLLLIVLLSALGFTGCSSPSGLGGQPGGRPDPTTTHGIPPHFKSLVAMAGYGSPSHVFLATDTLRVEIQATDSVGGAPWLGFRIPGLVQDSMPGVIISVGIFDDGHRDTVYGRALEVPIQSGWVGYRDVHAFVRDSAGNVIDSIIATASILSSTPTSHPVTSADLTTPVADWVYDAKRNALYLASATQNSIATGRLLRCRPRRGAWT